MTIKFLRPVDGYPEGAVVTTLPASRENAYVAAGAATKTLGDQTPLVSAFGAPAVAISSAAPNNADGRADGTVYIQTA